MQKDDDYDDDGDGDDDDYDHKQNDNNRKRQSKSENAKKSEILKCVQITCTSGKREERESEAKTSKRMGRTGERQRETTNWICGDVPVIK